MNSSGVCSAIIPTYKPTKAVIYIWTHDRGCHREVHSYKWHLKTLTTKRLEHVKLVTLKCTTAPGQKHRVLWHHDMFGFKCSHTRNTRVNAGNPGVSGDPGFQSLPVCSRVLTPIWAAPFYGSVTKNNRHGGWNGDANPQPESLL